MENMPEPVFEPLPMRRRTIEPVGANLYRIISMGGEAKQVQAVTAYEAFRQSGFTQALKIERVVNFEKDLLESNKFIDHMSFRFKEPVADVTTEKEDPSLTIKRRTIVSADELDSLIRSIHEIALSKDNSSKLVLAHAPMMQSIDDGLVDGLVAGPAGMDVHGDGFDEIIPSAPAPKLASVRVVEVAEIIPAPVIVEEKQTADPVSAPAERELSQEEIEGLLSGNTPPAET